MSVERRNSGPYQIFDEPVYRDTPELKLKLEKYQAMEEKLIPPIRIIKEWGYNVRSAAKLNAFIIENWPDTFPTTGTIVRIPGNRTEEFLQLWENDIYQTFSLLSLEEREVFDRINPDHIPRFTIR